MIDGAITSALSANDWTAYDIVKTGYMVNMTMGHQVMMVNSAELASFPADVSDILAREVQGMGSGSIDQMSEEGDIAARKNLLANKVTLVDPDAADDRRRVR